MTALRRATYNRRVRLLRLIVLLAAVAASAGCGARDDGTSAPASLDGTWQLVSGTGSTGPIEAPEGYPITATFEDGRIGGRAACNSYGGSVRTTDGRFELDGLSATEMGCEPAAMAAEGAYLDALAGADQVRHEVGRLTLTGPATELVFEPVPPVPAKELVGTRWRLETLILGETATSTSGVATLRLGPDGAIEGATGCRDFVGSYVLRGAEVVVTQLTMLGEPCPPELEQQDELVVSVIGDGFRADVEGNALTLTSGRDGLVFRAG